MRATMCLLTAVMTAGGAGCGGSPTAPTAQVFAFEFSSGATGWIGGVADYSTTHEPILQFVADYRPLLPPLPSDNALFLSAHAGGSLFMFSKRRVSGLRHDQRYHATFEVQIATNLPQGCVGPVGSAEDHTFVVAGASGIEPKSVLRSDGRYRMNIDKGNSTTPGRNALTLGHVANSRHCDDKPMLRWELRTVTSSQPVTVEADEDGAVWLLAGIASSTFGTMEFFITKFTATLTPA